MGQEKFIPEQHRKTRSFFRYLGPVMLSIGVLCMLVAAIDFFTIQAFEEPKLFWLFFVGMPIIFFGFVFSSLGFGGSIVKYQSREYAPVAKDTFNYLAKEMTPGVIEISNALQQGKASNPLSTCHNCQQKNPMDAKFCNTCGEKLVLICHGCQHENTNDSHFCNHCGLPVE